jgi:hypothetical protein
MLSTRISDGEYPAQNTMSFFNGQL